MLEPQSPAIFSESSTWKPYQDPLPCGFDFEYMSPSQSFGNVGPANSEVSMVLTANIDIEDILLNLGATNFYRVSLLTPFSETVPSPSLSLSLLSFLIALSQSMFPLTYSRLLLWCIAIFPHPTPRSHLAYKFQKGCVWAH